MNNTRPPIALHVVALSIVALSTVSCASTDEQTASRPEPAQSIRAESESMEAPSAKSAPTSPSVAEPELAAELLEMKRADQEIREKITSIIAEANAAGDQPDIPMTLAMEMLTLDQRNTARLKEIVAKHAWPTRSLVGEEASSAAWLLVQHAGADELSFMEEAASLIKAAAETGEAEPEHYAYLIDRIRMYRGEPQLFGTQTNMEDGRIVLHEIEDPESVDDRRAEHGLPPLQEYLDQMQEQLRGDSP